MSDADTKTDQRAQSVPDFDINRATLSDKDVFQPFYVKTTRPLREALASGDVHEDTSILLMEGNRKALALLTQQMCYHHVAQGEIAGEPWMVSF